MAVVLRWPACVVAALWLAMALPGPVVPVAAQGDLDALMRDVLGRRDENWKKLAQYVLDEREQFSVRGGDGATLFGERRDYTWFIRDGVFVRSPLRVNGAVVGDADRRRAEQQFLKEEAERERRRLARSGAPADSAPAVAVPADAAPPVAEPAGAPAGDDIAALVGRGRQPQFVSSAYFLRFTFEPGRYALVGHEAVDGRDTLKIEYYPSALFREPRRRDGRRARNDQVAAETRRLMNKVSLVTLWVEPRDRQILKYTFDNVTLDFLPAQWFARVTDVRASMTMAQPFPGVWLPHRIEATMSGMLAVGTFAVHYATEYVDYRQADVGTRVVVPDGR